MVSYEEQVERIEIFIEHAKHCGCCFDLIQLEIKEAKKLKEEIEKGCGEEMEIENYFNIEGNIKTVKCGEEDGM